MTCFSSDNYDGCSDYDYAARNDHHPASHYHTSSVDHYTSRNDYHTSSTTTTPSVTTTTPPATTTTPGQFRSDTLFISYGCWLSSVVGRLQIRRIASVDALPRRLCVTERTSNWRY